MRSYHRFRQQPLKDGLIIFWPSCFSPSSKTESQAGLITVGPQLCSISEPKADHDVLRFLERQGPLSIVYISFGSHSWVPSLQQTNLLFDVLDKLGLGALVVNSAIPEFTAPRKDLLEILHDRLGRMGDKGMLTDWAPQDDVLRHRVSILLASSAT